MLLIRKRKWEWWTALWVPWISWSSCNVSIRKNTLTIRVLDDAVWQQVDTSMIFFSQLFCSNSFRNRNVLAVFVFLFQLKGGTGGLSVLFCHRVFFELFKFCPEAVCSPPPPPPHQYFWSYTIHQLNPIGRVGGQQLHAPYTAVLFFCLMYKCALVCAHLFLSVLWQNSWRYTFKKKKNEKKIIKKKK